MRTAKWRIGRIVGVVAASLTLAQVGTAQDAPGRTLALVGGALQYDLSGTGWTNFGGLRLEIPLSRFFLVEPALTYARYEPQFAGEDVSLLFPEVQLQVQTTPRRVRPFLGVGAGPAFAWGGGQSETQLSLSVGAGLRVALDAVWGARGELRVRAIDPFVGTTAEWTAGLSRRF